MWQLCYSAFCWWLLQDRLEGDVWILRYLLLICVKHYVQQKVNRKFVNSKHLHFLHKTIYHFCECERTFYDNRAVFLVNYICFWSWSWECQLNILVLNVTFLCYCGGCGNLYLCVLTSVTRVCVCHFLHMFLARSTLFVESDNYSYLHTQCTTYTASVELIYFVVVIYHHHHHHHHHKTYNAPLTGAQRCRTVHACT